MPDDNRFFRYVWRFNAIVLALAVLVLCAGVGWNLLSTAFMKPSATPPEGQFAPVPKAAEREFTYRLDANQTVSELGSEKIFTLKRWRGEGNPYGLADIGPRYSSSSPDNGMRDVNLMAIDARNAASHWLFHGYQRSILSVDAVYASKSSSDAPPAPMSVVTTPAIAVAIEVVAADTNGDGELNEKDRQTLYVYRAGDSGAVKLLDADFVLAASQLDGARYLVVYEQGAKATAAIYAIPSFKLLSQAPLPNVPQ